MRSWIAGSQSYEAVTEARIRVWYLSARHLWLLWKHYDRVCWTLRNRDAILRLANMLAVDLSGHYRSELIHDRCFASGQHAAFGGRPRVPRSANLVQEQCLMIATDHCGFALV